MIEQTNFQNEVKLLRLLIFLIIVVPAAEISVLLLSGKTIGFIPTISFIILTGIIGAWLAKRQGLQAIKRVQEQIRYGEPPGDAMLDGLCVLAGGIFLLAPGFITDFTGFFLLIPAGRNIVKPLLLKIIRKMIDRNQITIYR
ncbi:FxsA family protein [Metabacillus fastidiosus]|uniref:FxsA family protein n=1 Tax=Metabacillus fastidiosus TaxID=1458 RepID=UPI003D27D592